MAAELLKSAYEVAREERIARNKMLMRELELVPAAGSTSDGDLETAKTTTTASSTKRQRKVPNNAEIPVRRSTRHTPKDPETIAREEEERARLLEERREANRVRVEANRARRLNDDNDEEEEEEEDDEDVPYTAEEMHEKIAQLEALHEDRGTSYRNPTATYEHTYMRIRTMSNKALRTRVKVIENAQGRDCVVKMRMFAEMLVLCGKPNLAIRAREALDRLLVRTAVV